MTFIRETVLAALFELLNASATYQFAGRRLVPWNSQDAQPAIFQRLIAEEFKPLVGFGQPQEKTLKVEVWIYTKTGGPDDTPENAITPLLDALDFALAANTTFDGRQCLGLEGYVHHAWREGTTDISAGEMGDQAIAIATIHILVPAAFTAS